MLDTSPTRHFSYQTLRLRHGQWCSGKFGTVGTQLQYKRWEWERRSHWYKNVNGNAVPTRTRTTTPLDMDSSPTGHFAYSVDNSPTQCKHKNSSGDEIANVNFFTTSHMQRPAPTFVISTKHLRYLPTHQTDFQNGLVRLTRFAPQMDAPIAKLTRRDSSGDMGVGNYTLNSRLLPPVVLPKYSLNNRGDRN